MPIPNFPPPQNEAGAITQPRQLQRWLDANYQGGKLTRTRGYIQLPALQVINNNWQGWSDIIVAFNYVASNSFSLKPFEPQIGKVFTLCIMWKDSNYNVHRYSLWRSPLDVIYFDITPYTGQLIAPSFRLEIWSTSDIAWSQPLITFYTSVLGGLDYRYGSDFILADPTEITSFGESGTPINLNITVDNTNITVDNTTVTTDEEPDVSFSLPLQFPDGASPQSNTLPPITISAEDNLSSL